MLLLPFFLLSHCNSFDHKPEIKEDVHNSENEESSQNIVEKQLDCNTPSQNFYSVNFSDAGLLRVIADTQSSVHMTVAAKNLIKRLELQGNDHLLLGEGQFAYQITGDINIDNINSIIDQPVIFHRDSTIGTTLLSLLGSRKTFVEKYLDWFVVSPNIWHRENGKDKQVLGSVERMLPIAYLDSKDVNDKLRSVLEILVVASHEAGHRMVTELENSDSTSNEYNPLEEELICHDEEIKTMKVLMELFPEDETLLAHYDDISGRIETGKYLLKPIFGADFYTLTPMNTILGSTLIEDDIDPKILKIYAGGLVTGNPEKDLELQTAAKVALMYHEGEFSELNRIIELEGEGYNLLKFNARGVIKYKNSPLAVDVCMPSSEFNPATEELHYGYVNVIVNGNVHFPMEF
jgi:hypothetical protein